MKAITFVSILLFSLISFGSEKFVNEEYTFTSSHLHSILNDDARSRCRSEFKECVGYPSFDKINEKKRSSYAYIKGLKSYDFLFRLECKKGEETKTVSYLCLIRVTPETRDGKFVFKTSPIEKIEAQ